MKRLDGRKPDEMRPLTIKAGVLERAKGSALVKLGRTVAIAGVYGPTKSLSRRRQEPDKAYLECIYTMAPFSTDERIRPGPSRRSTEISKVIRQALESVVYLEEYPKAVIEVHIAILQAEASTRVAALNAASVALADAGIPMRDLVASATAGKIEGEYVLDIAGKEEDQTACDLPVAYSPREGSVSLLQMDGDLPVKDVQGVIKTAIKGCEFVYQKQKEALKDKWINAKEELKSL